MINMKGRPDLNGCVGRVYSWHGDKGRAGVRLDGEQGLKVGTLAVRPINLIEVHAAADQSTAADFPDSAISVEADGAVAAEPDVDAARLAAFYARATSASATMARETDKLHEKHHALCQAVGESRVKQWYDEHQSEVEEEQQRRAGRSEESANTLRGATCTHQSTSQEC